ncbi:hypothetical protein N7447_002552 [Penicillium robsamsonii]|uniref:uncharacterized protein n=1 Tax=Penicillium robsamsonii TaxID=1792511 RepID=UPI002549074E|nr:uncharacterized protein N7447_002552 [Penicillium robsamsonii]KAJ5836526.1 hypothetical protein N7447_002552 [Penicillium robsamsonii]
MNVGHAVYLLLYILHTSCVFAKDWSSLAFQVDRSTSRTLTDSKGNPVFWQADTAWEIFHRLNCPEVEYYLADRAAKNFNVIYGTILAEEDGLTVPNQNGDLPFIDYDPTKPNEPYFEWIDTVIEMSGKYGITIALAPTWGRWVNEGWHGSPVVLNTSNAAEFGNYVGQRYAGLPKIIGGDSNRWWFHKQGIPSQAKDKPLKIIDSGPVFNELAHAIHDAEARVLRGHGIHPFMTYHGTNVWFSAFPDSTASAMYGNQTWLSMDGVQTGHSDINSSQSNSFYGLDYMHQWVPIANQVAVKEMYNRTPVRPVMDLENHYEYWNSSISINEDGSYRWNSSFVRNGAWHALYAGSAGITYGEQAVWRFANPARFNAAVGLNETWLKGMERPASGQMKYLRSFVEQHLGTHRLPDQSLLTTSPRTEYAEVMAMRNRWSNWVTVFAPMGRSFGLNTGILSGRGDLQAWWFAPNNGSYFPLDQVTRGLNLTFTPPTGGTIDNDWVLLVKGG